MAERSGLARGVIAIVCLGGTALGLVNTYGDNSQVVKQAERVACGGDHCSFQKLREERSVLAQKFSFQVALVEKGKAQKNASADVECKRAYVLLGEYGCVRTSGGF